MPKERKRLLISMLALKGIGPSFLLKNEQIIKTALGLGYTGLELLRFVVGEKYDEIALTAALRKADQEIAIAEKSNIKIWDFLSSDFPRLLKDSHLKIPLLFSLGPQNFQGPTMGVIGSREPSHVAETITKRISNYYRDQGVSIVSGLAEGVDSIASSVGASIGVVPGGLAFEQMETLSKHYQESSRRLLDQGGSLVSFFLPSKKQGRYEVVEYCKLQAALSQALILVQSTVDGGSRFTVETFCQLKRPLGVVNITKYDKENIRLYEGNELIVNKGIVGVSEFCNVKEPKIHCQLHIIESKQDYQKLSPY